MASAPPPNEFPVFVDTNFGTHLAVSVSSDITSGKLRREHYLCFPNIGEISAHALMVKCKSCFYRIPDSVPIKIFFQGLKAAWFLQLDASLSKHAQNRGAPLMDNATMDKNSPDCPLSGNHEAQADKRNAHDTTKLQNEHSSCPKYQLEELPISMHGPRRKERLEKKCNSKDIICGSLRDAKMRTHASLGGYVNGENLLSDNSCEEHVSKVNHKRKVGSNDARHCGTSILRREFVKNTNLCIDSQSRHKRVLTEEIGEVEDRNCYRCIENNAKGLIVDRPKLVCVENGSPHITQKDQGACSSPQARIGFFSLVNETVDREDITSLSASDIISVTGIITRYFFDSDEVDSQAQNLRNTSECSEQNNDSRLRNSENDCHSFVVEECNSKTTTHKKLRKHKIQRSNEREKEGLHQKVSHDNGNEHPVNQIHLNESIKANSTPQVAAKSSTMQISLQWSGTPITDAPRSRSKLERSAVGKRLLLAANGLSISTGKQKPQSKCCSRVAKLSLLNSTVLHRSVFEISDRDD